MEEMIEQAYTEEAMEARLLCYLNPGYLDLLHYHNMQARQN